MGSNIKRHITFSYHTAFWFPAKIAYQRTNKCIRMAANLISLSNKNAQTYKHLQPHGFWTRFIQIIVLDVSWLGTLDVGLHSWIKKYRDTKEGEVRSL